MTAFYFSIALFLAFSALVIFIAWRGRLPDSAGDFVEQRIKRNIVLYKQRLQQLETDLVDEFLDKDDYEQLKAENARDLIGFVDKLESVSSQEVSSKHKFPWLVTLLFVPVAAILVYQSLGAYQDWQIAQKIEQLKTIKSEIQFTQHSDLLFEAIEERLQAKPDHIDYRVLLASFAMGKQDYQRAAIHYGMLAELLPKDATAQAFHAQSLYLRNGRKIDAEVASAMDRTLALDSHNNTILGLQGIDAYENGDYISAIEAWGKLLAVLDQNSQQGQMIAAGIAEAKKHLTDEQQQAISVSNDKALEQGITVDVSLAENLPSLDEDLMVFVYAKASNGPKLPLAVKRITVKELPIKIVLSDALSMTPQFKLSGFDNVVIGARVSVSGDPIAQQGDWFTQTENIKWRDHKQMTLVIDQKVK